VPLAAALRISNDYICYGCLDLKQADFESRDLDGYLQVLLQPPSQEGSSTDWRDMQQTMVEGYEGTPGDHDNETDGHRV
jgi:hypothetical protein